MIDSLNQLTAGLPGWMGDALGGAIVAAGAIAVALLAHYVFFRILRRFAKGSESATDDLLVRKLVRPTRYAFIALALALAAREVPALDGVWQKLAGFLMPALVGWIALALMQAFVKAMQIKNDIEVEDNLRARSAQTRLAIFSRIGTFMIIFITVGLMLLSIPGVRDIGVTLMASAGLAALAVGAAAQPALKALIGGVQLALTEPIRIGDAVIIGGEWGWIEEIRTTYVVVKVWDERRLVVPTNKFLEEIFQNWTKTTAQLLGTVFLYVDPATDVAPIREQFFKLVEANERWDGRVKWLQVTDLSRDAIELRMLMTAKDSPTLFDLRCDVREAMIDWVRLNMPEAIVRRRVETVGPVDVQGLGPASGEALAQMGGGKEA